MNDRSRDTILALVERSPRCVGAHDRDGWLALFSDDAWIEDPVGSPQAHKRTGVLARFWEAFIAPNRIRFEVSADHTFGAGTFRDAVIHTTTPSGLTVAVQAYLEYRVDPSSQGTKVERMRAFWSLRKMVWFVATSGPRAWFAMTSLFVGMIRSLGLRWVLRYLASLWRTIGARGLEALSSVTAAIEQRDSARLSALFASGAAFERAGAIVSAEELCESIAEGTRVRIEAPIVAGYHCAFRYRLAREGADEARGIGVLSFDPASGAPAGLALST